MSELDILHRLREQAPTFEKDEDDNSRIDVMYTLNGNREVEEFSSKKEAIEKKVNDDLGNMDTVEQMVAYFKNKREHFNEGT